MIALSVLPPLWIGPRLHYVLPFVLVDVLIVVFVVRLLKSRTPAEGRRAMRWLYMSGSLGLLAFLLGSLFT